MTRRSIAFVVMSLWLVLVVPAARADTGDIIQEQHNPPNAEDGWQAGTCTEDPITDQCKPEDPVTRFFRVAAGHPPIGFTQYIVKQEPVGGGLEIPIGPVKTIRVDLPPGLTVNPQATETRCTMEQFDTPLPPAQGEGPSCPASSQVGEERLTVKIIEGPNIGIAVPPTPGATRVPLFNLEPGFGEPARFGFKVGAPGSKKTVILNTEVAWESDYHESFTIHLPTPNPGTRSWKSRLVNFGRSGDGTYITNPTTCFSSQLPPYEGIYTTYLRAESVALPEADFPNSATRFASDLALPEGLTQTGCNSVPFDPGLDVTPGTTQVDSPATPTVETTLPFIKGGETQSESHLRNAQITLPQGMGLNPSAAEGLQSCTDAEFGKGTRNPVACPPGSRIGTVEVETPPLPAGALKGTAYLGQQLSRDPTSGDEFRLFVTAESAQYGISARLIGNTSANPKTGQLTTKFAETPQVPFTSVKVHLDNAKGVLSSPPTCSPATTTSTMEPWSTPKSTKHPESGFTLSTAPGGGTCPTTMAGRPFAPSYTAKSDSSKANAYSPFRVNIGRPDGQQELKRVDVTLPKGHAGNLTGIPYCPESALDAAAASSGVAERANPSCSSKSEIGTASTLSGTGSSPIKISGKAYLAGPYREAPLSLAIVTPAVAGPFDLGTVVVRVALFVDPVTAQVHAVSDAIPDVYGGVKLDIRSVDVDVDRKMFMHNPTNCAAQATSGFLNGGGANPTDPALWSSYAVSSPFQATACNKLGFKPKLHTRLFGGKNTTTRGKHPKLRAILEARKQDANVLRSALALPHALFLDQGNIRTVCTRPQLASGTCPKAAIYGHAQARSPLLGKALKGPVYLISSDHELPDLLADLRGQVNIQVRGVISSKNGGIKTVFNNLPDVPVKKFILRMEGGKKKGLLVNSRSLCKDRLSSVMSMKGQNGKKIKNNHLPLRVSGC
ncbi:MAG TPA: hypothetical protein VGC63_05965 [Solirubrobacterales bacterium]|jgi:hypothetical protein